MKKLLFSWNLRTKLLITLLIAFLLVFLFLGGILYQKMLKQANEQLGEKLLGIAQTTALALDIDKHEALKTKEDEKSPYYQEMIKRFTEIMEKNNLPYLYTERLKGDKVSYVLDASTGEMHASIGDEDQLDDYQKKAFQGQTVITSLYLYQWKGQQEYLKTAYVPLKNKEG